MHSDLEVTFPRFIENLIYFHCMLKILNRALIAVLCLVGLALIYLALTVPEAEELEETLTDEQAQVEDVVEEAIPETSPTANTNPFEGTYTNPFE